ncbi:MAG: hypothetical protein IIV47_03610, partial [Clostridia bacterium]|nr:hypothetical protein [Clostridia bacterium]
MEKKGFDIKKVTKINVDEAKKLLKEREEKSSSGKKLFGIKDKKNLKGITRRWATNTLLITALILLVLVVVSILFVVQYYRNYVVSYISDYANETVTTFFTPYVDGSNEVFEQ